MPVLPARDRERELMFIMEAYTISVYIDANINADRTGRMGYEALYGKV
jgi:hypothetical protein